MKKTISISISGMLFHIEEDGYEKLKNYLGNIHQYFSKYEDHQEIVDDIESRIAEILSAKINSPSSVISLKDIEDLIKIMGTTMDFKKSEEIYEEKSKEAETEKTQNKKRLYRDKKHKIIGGVASGIAHYFKIDAFIVRLIWIVFFIGSSFIKIITAHSNFSFSLSLGGFALISYIILWIAIPKNDQLEDYSAGKKLFRNPDQKKIGGVASGLSEYLQVDVTIIRIAFLLSILLGGGGIIFYIILWIITPEAKTVTEKMQMQGESLTLSNIDQNIQKEENERKAENKMKKIILLPFQAIGKVIKPLTYTVRVTSGLFLSLISIIVMIGLIIAWSAILGLVPGNVDVVVGDISTHLINDLLTPSVLVFSFIILFVPFLGLFIAGIKLIAIKRKIISIRFIWMLMIIWFLSIGGLTFSIIPHVKNFRYREEISKESFFNIKKKQTLKIQLHWMSNKKHEYRGIKIKLKPYNGNQLKIVQTYSSRGSTASDAQSNAEKINYPIQLKDSTLILNERIEFNDSSLFRLQRMQLTIYIPYGQHFYLDSSWNSSFINLIYDDPYNMKNIGEHTWMFFRGERMEKGLNEKIKK